mgnify:CR=1 FL=1
MKTKKKKKSRNHKSRGKSKKIIDPKLSKRKHHGTAATPNEIFYHYQKYSNIMEYLSKLIRKEKIKNVLLFKNPIHNLLSLDLNNSKKIPKPYYISSKEFENKIKNSLAKYRIIPIVLSIDMKSDSEEGGRDSHANMIIIDTKTKKIELFEPHGSRSTSSELGNVSAAYTKKQRRLKKYFKHLLKDYQFINVVDSIKRSAFQILYDPDEHTGYCVTWATLYANYRILNMNIKPQYLVKYLDKTIHTKKLLNFAATIEDTLKFDFNLKN